MIFFPPHLKFVALDVDADPETTGVQMPLRVQTRVRTGVWHTSVVLAWVVVAHLCVFVASNIDARR
jgi:hypothetical protein